MSKSDQVQRKFIETINVSDWQVETEGGWVDITHSNKTVPYEMWEMTTEGGAVLRGADTHIIIDEFGDELYLHESLGEYIKTKRGIDKVISVGRLDYSVNMYDLTVDSEEHTYYTGDILSHNTTCSVGFLLHYAMFKPESHLLIASKTGKDASDIMGMVRFAYEHLPDHIRAGVRQYNVTSMIFDNDSKIESTTTTESTGRGKALSLIYLDEFAFIDPPRIAKELWTSLSPTLSTGGGIIVTSTPNSTEDQFAQIWFDAQHKFDEHGEVYPNGMGKNGFGSYMATYKDHPDRDEKWAESERSAIGEARFKREHECEFIDFDETLINAVKLSRLKPKNPIRTSGHVRWFKKINPDMTYVVALDPSMGTGGDNAAITIWELPSMEQVGEWYHNMTPVEGQMRVFMDILHEINDQGNPDIYWSLETNSIGEAAMVIIRDTGQENFPGTFLHEPRVDGGARRKKGFVTTQRTKRIACSRLKHWLESGKLTIHSGPLIKELKNYIAKSNTYMAKQGCTDDVVSSTLVFIRMAEVIAKWDDSTSDAVNGDLNGVDYDEDDPSCRPPLPLIL